MNTVHGRARPSGRLARWAAMALTLLLLGTVAALTPASPAAPQEAETPATAIITNGVVKLGINAEGHLNVPGGIPSSGDGTQDVGLRYIHEDGSEAESTSPGCLCEGWGAADALSGATGFANVSSDGGVNNLELVSFDVTETEAVSVVHVGPPPPSGEPEGEGDISAAAFDFEGPPTLEVTHDYHPSSSPNLYEVTVTIRNLTGSTVEPRYRRVMDWDTDPTPFEEFVTIDGSPSPFLLYSSNDGFASADPLSGPSDDGLVGPPDGEFFQDQGPDDHGALFDFGFGDLAPAGTAGGADQVRFNIYYGAAGNENDALLALDFVGATLWSLGQPSDPHDPAVGTPNTFIFGFGAVGGEPVPRLAIRKRADSPETEAGGANGYTIVFTNPTGSDASVTDVTDTLPAGFVYQAGSSTFDGAAVADPTMTGNVLAWPGPFTVPSFSTRSLHFGVMIPAGQAGGRYLNTVTAEATNASGPLAVRSTGPVAPVSVPFPVVADEVKPEISDGSMTVDPDTGDFTLRIGRFELGGAPLTVSAAVSCPDGSEPVSVLLRHGGFEVAMTSTDGVMFVGDIPRSSFTDGAPVEIVADCAGTIIPNTVGTIVLYDPSGIVSDAATGAPIVGATVTLFKIPFAQPDSAGVTRDCRTVDTRPGGVDWSGVPAANLASGEQADPALLPAEISPLVNPQITGADGRYGWDVAAGCWFVRVEAPGYNSVTSALVGVPPEVTDLHVALTKVGTGGPIGPIGGTPPPATPQPTARPIDDSCPADRVEGSTFKDISTTNVHRAAIDCAAWWDLAKGFTAERFGPAEHVTRAQMASFIARLVENSGGTLPANPANRFGDDDSSVHHANINKLADPSVAIISGRADGTYGPDDLVTRAQMASFIVRAYEYRTGTVLSSTPTFFDEPIPSAHVADVQKAAGVGFTGGAADGLYHPDDFVRRDQMTSFLARVLDLIVERGLAPLPT